MKPDYKNWIPKGMLFSLIAGTVLSFALLLFFGIFGIGVGGKLRVVLGVVFGIAFVVCAKSYGGYEIKLVKGEDIRYWYNSENYYAITNTLGNSCMSHEYIAGTRLWPDYR